MNQLTDLPAISSLNLRSRLALSGPPKNVAELLSRARSEFINAHDLEKRQSEKIFEPDVIQYGPFEGPYMKLVTELFKNIAWDLYSTDFIWSGHNKKRWEIFVYSWVGDEGGACIFSMQSDGELSKETLGTTAMQGLGVGVPFGMFPYALWPQTVDDEEKLRATIERSGYTTDLLS